MDILEIKDLVRHRYGAFADAGGAQAACCSAIGQTASGDATDPSHYTAEQLAMVPKGALSLSRGCGNPIGFAGLHASEAVVDLGCGGGIDVVLAAHAVGSAGGVVGVDAAPQMIKKARENLVEAGLGAQRVDLRVADLADTGLPAGCADVVISNCVMNLCPDKDAAYQEAFRILRPGGRLAISDMMWTEQIAPDLEASFESTWAGCVGGALPVERYFETVRQAGFEHISVVGEHPFSAGELDEMACCPGPDFTPKPAQADLDAVQGKLTSIKFTAHKPS